jgi:hypothetical protein
MGFDDVNQRIQERLYEMHLPEIKAELKQWRKETGLDANWPDTSVNHPARYRTNAQTIPQHAQDGKREGGYAGQTPKFGLDALFEDSKKPTVPGALVKGLYQLRGFEVIAYDDTHPHAGKLTDIFG